MDLMTAKIKLANAEGRREALQASISDATKKLTDLRARNDNIAQATLCVQKTAQELQANITSFFKQCVQSALDIVFPKSYIFNMEFTSRRNQAELDMWLERGNERVSVLDAAGGGVVDVVSFSLRVACLLLSKKRKFLLLDEPFKFIRGEARERLGDLLSFLAKKSQIQVLMVADVAATPIEDAKRFKVSINGGESLVNVIY